MYAIVTQRRPPAQGRGRRHADRRQDLRSRAGESMTLPAVLLVDDAGAVTSDAAALAKTTVTAEVVEQIKGPKIQIHLFKNKTGYHRRQGHRAQLTTLRVTGIETGK